MSLPRLPNAPDVRQLAHTIVLARDLAKAKTVYTALLGCEPARCFEIAEAGVSGCVFALSNTNLQILVPRESGEFEEGLLALVFLTSSLGAFEAGLEAHGFAAESLRVDRDVASAALSQPWRCRKLPVEMACGTLIVVTEEDAPLFERSELAPALDHVVVRSPDLEASRRLYQEVLGLRLALDRTFDRRGVRILFFRVGGVTLEVVGKIEPEAESGTCDELWGLAYRVKDIDAERERLAGIGFDVSEVRSGAKPGTRVCTVHHETHGVATLLIGSASS